MFRTVRTTVINSFSVKGGEETKFKGAVSAICISIGKVGWSEQQDLSCLSRHCSQSKYNFTVFVGSRAAVQLYDY